MEENTPTPAPEPRMTVQIFHDATGYRAKVDFPNNETLSDTIKLLETCIFVMQGTKQKFLDAEDDTEEE